MVHVLKLDAEIQNVFRRSFTANRKASSEHQKLLYVPKFLKNGAALLTDLPGLRLGLPELCFSLPVLRLSRIYLSNQMQFVKIYVYVHSKSCCTLKLYV